MNESVLPGPCAGYEVDIVELVDGTLTPDREREVRAHLNICTRCGTWQASFAGTDAMLADALPRPMLSADFATRLKERLAQMPGAVVRGDLRAAAERERRWTLQALARGARRNAVIGAATATGIAACIASLAIVMQPVIEEFARHAGALQERGAAGALAAAFVLGALAWSAMRGGLPGLRIRR